MPVPGLLVSVRNVEEAKLAARHDVQIIDIKEPGRGSLGCASVDVLIAIARFFEQETSNQATAEYGKFRETSVALGEILDFSSVYHPRFFGSWADQFHYAKFGLSAIGTKRTWWNEWDLKLRLLPTHFHTVAVAYVDHETCQVPPPKMTLQVGHELGCRAFLLDTFTKTAGNLFDYCEKSRLVDLVARAKELKMKTVFAGSINLHNVREAVSVMPDFIGVRGAVCSGNRESNVCGRKLSEFIQRRNEAEHTEANAENRN